MISVVVPTYNEAATIPVLADRLAQAMGTRAWELVVVDDGSPDGTADIAERLAPALPVRVVRRAGKLGLATAVMAGFAAAIGETLVVMDADLSHPPEALPAMVRALSDGADFVVGSRYVPGGSVDDGWSAARRLNSRVATALAAPLTRVRDPLAGFFALPRHRWPAAGTLAPLGYKIGLELLVKTRPATVSEIPIRFADRHVGESKLDLRVQLQYLRHLARLYRFRQPLLVEMVLFVLVGSLGLALDVAVYAGLQRLFGLHHLVARAVSFVVAATHNWYLNRRVTFDTGRSRPATAQWASYLALMMAGFTVNVGTYALLTTQAGFGGRARYAALVIGVLAGTAVNFTTSRALVFAARRVRRGPADAAQPVERAPDVAA